MTIRPLLEVKAITTIPKVQSKGAEISSKGDKPTTNTSVDKFVNDVFDIISPLLSEVIQ
jgi:hypothetical protein